MPLRVPMPEQGPNPVAPGSRAATDWLWPLYRRQLSAGARDRDQARSSRGSRPGSEPAGPIPIPTPRLPGLASACFIEWRYFAVLSPAFHGIAGLALVNPDCRFPSVAEGGLLLIVAGVVDRPRLPSSAAEPGDDAA